MITGELVEAVQRVLVADRSDPTGVAVARAIRQVAPGVASDAEMLRLIRIVQQELSGAGVLDALLADPATTDVVVNGPDQVLVDRGRGWEPAGVSFPDAAAVQRLARRLAGAAGRRLDDAVPFVDARLPDGTRLHAVLEPLAASGTCLSLRVLRPATHRLHTLGGSLPGCSIPALRAIMAARLSFLVSGGTGSGKTTLLGALLAEVSPDDRLVLVEDAEELRPDHPHLVRLVARTANVEGAGAIGMRELVRQALRMRPDRLVVGEVRGAEVAELLAALNTGHEGGAGTVHANSAAEVPARLEALGAMAGLDRVALHAQLAGAVQVVLHLRRTAAGRRLSEIGVLTRVGDQVAVVPAVVDGIPDRGWPDLVGRWNAAGVPAPC